MAEKRKKRGTRRVVRPSQPGTDPKPGDGERVLAAEDDPVAWGDSVNSDDAESENDERLRRDKPPHW